MHCGSDCITALALSPDGRYLFAGGSDKTIARWETSSGAVRAEARVTDRSVTACVCGAAITDAGRALCLGLRAGCCAQRPLRVLRQRRQDREAVGRIDRNGRPFSTAADGRAMRRARCVAAGADHGRALRHRSCAGRVARRSLCVLWQQRHDREEMGYLEWSGACCGWGWIAAGRSWWCVLQLDRTMEGHAGKVFAVAVSPDGRFVYSGSSDTSLKQWDALSGAVCAAALADDAVADAFGDCRWFGRSKGTSNTSMRLSYRPMAGLCTPAAGTRLSRDGTHRPARYVAHCGLRRLTWLVHAAGADDGRALGRCQRGGRVRRRSLCVLRQRGRDRETMGDVERGGAHSGAEAGVQCVTWLVRHS
jgi:hypothetical protein